MSNDVFGDGKANGVVSNVELRGAEAFTDSDPLEESITDDAAFDTDLIDWDALDDSDTSVGELDLDARNSLRRIPGFSTELSDITEVEYRQLRLEKVVLVGVWASGTEEDAENAMYELAALADTAGSQVLDAFMQRRKQIDPATYIGRGKVDEVRDAVRDAQADTVICDGELTPAQLRNLEDRIKVKVVDRSALILDIFAQHAKSAEGKAQVELAQLQYLKQRLRGWGDSLSRQVGGRASGGVGIGGRGPGETKIETDRRRINTRISKLKQHLRRLDAQRALKRAERQRNLVPSVAIVGYTNAGKSSLLNRLTDAGVLVDDALFATLDPTTRRLKTSDGRTYTLTDTVGFVRHLPHELVEAFASTLEEVAQADLLVHVVDGTERDPLGQVAAVRTVLENIGAADLPEILVINKIDKVSAETLVNLRHSLPTALFISARNGTGLIALKMAIEATLPTPDVEVDVVVPWHRGDLVDKVHRSGNLIESAHVVAGTRVHARVNPALAAELAAL